MRCLLFFPRCCGVNSPPMTPSFLYLKPLRNSNTFLHIIYKSKKKTNLLCILNNVFQYSKIRTRKRNAKKSIKTEKIWNPALFGIRNPLSWNPESSTRNPESTGRNPESKTVMDSLTWGDALSNVFCSSIQTLSTSSLASLNVTFSADVPFSPVSKAS